jgi:mannosyltransferase OCH1-like enzyme
VLTIHQIWVGSPPPEHLVSLSATWREQHPAWGYTLWDDEAIESFGLRNRELYDRAEELVPADAVGQYRADIARYEILYRRGGVYADMDTTCQKPIDPLIVPGKMTVGWEVQNRFIGNTVIYAPKGHPALREIIEKLPEWAREAPARPNKLSGPKAISTVLRNRTDVVYLDSDIWYPVPWDQPERSTDPHPNAYVVHHWQHQRDLRGIPWT